MKKQPFARRLSFALAGIAQTARSEASFRTQLIGALAALSLLVILRPEPIWWALLALTTAGVLSAELLNTALELTLDRIHPEHDPRIGLAKDCAAGAVLVFSLASLGVAAALIAHAWPRA